VLAVVGGVLGAAECVVNGVGHLGEQSDRDVGVSRSGGDLCLNLPDVHVA
jgi:hypothetical protein